MTATACPDCGSPELAFLGVLPDTDIFAGKRLDTLLHGGSLYSCSRCSLLFRFPMLEAERYQHLYDNSLAEAWTLDESRLDQKLISQYVSTNLASGSRVLDVGCYSGALLGSLDRRFERFGVEINAAAAQIARTRFNVAMWPSIAAIPNNTFFDAILAVDVIEHMRSPRAFVESLMPLLSPRGVVILSTGDAQNIWWKMNRAKWWYCSFAEHVAFISRPWLQYHSSGLKVAIKEARTFYYKKRRLHRPLRAALLAYLLAPRLYKRLQGRSTGVPGCGISADHLFVVLCHAHAG